VRNLDKSGRGFLTNDKVYALMQEQLAMQKSMFKMKKIIAGLLAFVFILALANLGTSFASAILAKDTTTSNGELVDKNTNEAVATASAVKDYLVAKDDGDNARTLQACTVDENTATAACDTSATTTSGTTTMPAGKAQNMLQDCYESRNVNLKTTSGRNVNTMPICGTTCGTSEFTFPESRGAQPIAGKLCIQGSTSKLIVTKNSSSKYNLVVTDETRSIICPTITANPTNCPDVSPVPVSDCGSLEEYSDCKYYTTMCGCTVVTQQSSCTPGETVMTMALDYLPCDNVYWYGGKCLEDSHCNTSSGGDFGTAQYLYCVDYACSETAPEGQ